MKLVKSSVEVIKQKPGIQGIFENIEIGARNCYKSESVIKYDDNGNSLTAASFVDKIVNVFKHQSVAEHGAVYLVLDLSESMKFAIMTLTENPYTKIVQGEDGKFYVTTNYRVILENKLEYCLHSPYLCEVPTKYHEKRITTRWICSRSISHQLVRHRSLSFSQESQRYVNYSKSKFENQLTYIIPEWATNLVEGDIDFLSSNLTYRDGNKIRLNDETLRFLQSLKDSENAYMSLINSASFKPEDARELLPNATKTELIVSGFESDWKKFFDLRCDSHAQAGIRNLSNQLKNEMSLLWE